MAEIVITTRAEQPEVTRWLGDFWNVWPQFMVQDLVADALVQHDPGTPSSLGCQRRSTIRSIGGMSTTERNKATVRDLIDGLFTKGDLGAVDTYLAEDFINHDPPFGVSPDREGMRVAGAMMREEFPDWHSELHELVAEGDIVVERFTASGTQQGEVMGIAPTGKTVSLPGTNR